MLQSAAQAQHDVPHVFSGVLWIILYTQALIFNLRTRLKSVAVYETSGKICIDTQMFSMQKTRNSAGAFLFFCSLAAGSSIFVFIWLLLSPSEPGNSIIFGLSLPRLVFACGLLVVFIIFIALFIRAVKDHQWAENMLEQWFSGGRFSRVTRWLAGISFGLSWLGYFLPPYRTAAPCRRGGSALS